MAWTQEPADRIHAIRHAVVWAAGEHGTSLAAADSAALKVAATKAVLEVASDLK